MRECYKDMRFKSATLAMIDTINSIINEYQAAGYVLTVRQLYYQLVARDIIPNTLQSYKTTAQTVNDARIAGLIDWDAIEDRTRAFKGRSRFESPQDVLYAAASSYHTDPWETQDSRVFLVVEKEALSGVFSRVCREFDVPMLAARGYPSASVIREFARSHIADQDAGQNIVILHFGDHDPSGIDMTRDLEDRFNMFGYEQPFELIRLALNRDQVEELKPPPNPAKTTDARFKNYRKKYGTESWELDAIQPDMLADIARANIEAYIDPDPWQKWHNETERQRKRINEIARNFE